MRRLKAAMAAVKDKRTYVRLEAVLGVALGDSIQKIAIRLSKSSRSVQRWCALYLQHHDPYSLVEGKRSGRPQPLRPSQKSAFYTLQSHRLHPPIRGIAADFTAIEII